MSHLLYVLDSTTYRRLAELNESLKTKLTTQNGMIFVNLRRSGSCPQSHVLWV